ncbi:GFA family protein [Shimia sp. NS0008-38b]|uniref:GFA family protein n=1 Tax=Shimia sp. NS0008-38b TaxID=3127653 RepID=UPI003104673C
MIHKLTCHCGAVELSVELAQDPSEARLCDCSFCRRRAAPNVDVALDDLTIVKGHECLTLYTWGTGTAKHYFCRNCGIYTHHRRRSNPDVYGVNIGALENVNPSDFAPFQWVDGVSYALDETADKKT